jgi:hypothetical protein
MAGIKHHLQGYGIQSGDYEFNKVKDPIERDLAFQTMNVTPHCKKCGQLILPPAMEDRRDYQLELKWQMHEDCIRDVEAELKAKQRAEQAKLLEEQKRKEEEAKNFDWEEYMRKHFENKEG